MPYYPPQDTPAWRDLFACFAVERLATAENRLKHAERFLRKAIRHRDLTKRQRDAIAKRCARIYAMLREIDAEIGGD